MYPVNKLELLSSVSHLTSRHCCSLCCSKSEVSGPLPWIISSQIILRPGLPFWPWRHSPLLQVTALFTGLGNYKLHLTTASLNQKLQYNHTRLCLHYSTWAILFVQTHLFKAFFLPVRRSQMILENLSSTLIVTEEDRQKKQLFFSVSLTPKTFGGIFWYQKLS